MKFTDKIKRGGAAVILAATPFLPGCGRPDPVYVTSESGQRVLIDTLPKYEAKAHISKSFEEIMNAAEKLGKIKEIRFPTTLFTEGQEPTNFYTNISIASENAARGNFDEAARWAEGALELLPNVKGEDQSPALKKRVEDEVEKPTKAMVKTMEYLAATKRDVSTQR